MNAIACGGSRKHFVDEGLFGDIPKHLENYIDYDAIAVILLLIIQKLA